MESPCFVFEDVQRVLIEEVNNLPKETRPTVLAAQDARKVISELCEGIGRDMEKFRSDIKLYLEDIRDRRGLRSFPRQPA